MMRLLLAGFLLAHGLIHPGIFAIPKDPDEPEPFDPANAWAFEAAHVAAHQTHVFGATVSALTAFAFLLAVIALFMSSPAWVPLAMVGAGLGLLLKGLFFDPWLSAGVFIDLGILATGLLGAPQSWY